MGKTEVKRFDDEKGYGFIDLKSSDDDEFVHHSDIQVHGYDTLSAICEYGGAVDGN